MGEILSRINGPDDVKRLTSHELTLLAEEIRTEIIGTVSRTGGHLAPSLGVVELALAVHRVFDSPRDRIIWDVGHQSYAHKLVTGRRERFCTLRQPGGISGFPKRAESAHDAFDTGHSSTSVSAALGLAQARDLKGETHRVVAVIGDGALTGGMAFEALNNAGDLGIDLTVILNDNSMSIGRNVGAITRHLSRLRTEPVYSRLRDDIDSLLRRIPRIGPSVSKTVDRIKQGLKYVVLEGMLFEELGFTYLGPIDGHDLGALTDVLRRARHLRGPVVVHVVTTKGRGYRPAEDNPSSFHGTGPFDPETGQPVGGTPGPSYSSLFGRALVELGRRDERVVAITAAMRDGTGLTPFAEEFPCRFFDVGIAEQHAVTFAAGLAAGGLRPVVAVYSTFLQRAYDQIVHDVCLPNLPVVFALDRAGLVGEDGETHHGSFDLAYLGHVPNLTVMAPSDAVELAAMVRGTADLGGPAAIRYPRGGARQSLAPGGGGAMRPGTARVLRGGGDVALIAIGSMVETALDASDILRSRGVSASVVDSRFLRPLAASDILGASANARLVVTLEEGTVAGGFGAAVTGLVNTSLDDPPRVLNLGLPPRFVGHGRAGDLLAELGLDAGGVAKSVLSALPTTQHQTRRAGHRG